MNIREKLKDLVYGIGLRREDLISILALAVSGILTCVGVLTREDFMWIIGIILSYYLGQTQQYRRLSKKQPKLEFLNEEYKKMLRRFGAILMISGITLLLEKFIMSGSTLTYPPLADHALWGLLLVVVGWILLIKKEKKS